MNLENAFNKEEITKIIQVEKMYEEHMKIDKPDSETLMELAIISFLQRKIAAKITDEISEKVTRARLKAIKEMLIGTFICFLYGIEGIEECCDFYDVFTAFIEFLHDKDIIKDDNRTLEDIIVGFDNLLNLSDNSDDNKEDKPKE